MPPKKTKAEVRRLATSAAMKKYKDFSAIRLGRELNKLQKQFKIDPAEGTKIKIAVVKKLISKVSDKEISATEARKELKKKVPAKKKVTKKEFEKARKDLKDKKVSTPKKKKEPKKTPPPDVNMLMSVMNVMTEVAKEKGKSTQSDIDEKVKMDKKARDGKLTQRAFLEFITTEDGYDEAIDEDYENRFEGILYNAPDNMTETQQERYFDKAGDIAYRSAKKFRDALFKKLIKGKKFKSVKEASELFIKNINKYHPDLDV